MKFKITCDQASTICDKKQYLEASFWERLSLAVHLLSCKICALYVTQNKKMSDLFKVKSTVSSKENTSLTPKEKETLQETLQDKFDVDFEVPPTQS